LLVQILPNTDAMNVIIPGGMLMIKTEFLDSEFYPVNINEASIIVCREVDENGNELQKRIFRNLTNFSEKVWNHSINTDEQHWENAKAIQKIIDNLWLEYHKTESADEKIRISRAMIDGYANLDRLVTHIEMLRDRKRRFD
jgi:hypothetical protein